MLVDLIEQELPFMTTKNIESIMEKLESIVKNVMKESELKSGQSIFH